MNRPGYKTQFLRFRWQDGSSRAHPDLMRLLVEEAEEKRTSRVEVILSILARAYGVSHSAPTRRPAGSRPSDRAENFHIAIPLPIYQAVAVSAIANGRKDTDEILFALHAHYGLRVPPPPARRVRRVAA